MTTEKKTLTLSQVKKKEGVDETHVIKQPESAEDRRGRELSTNDGGVKGSDDNLEQGGVAEIKSAQEPIGNNNSTDSNDTNSNDDIESNGNGKKNIQPEKVVRIDIFGEDDDTELISQDKAKELYQSIVKDIGENIKPFENEIDVQEFVIQEPKQLFDILDRKEFVANSSDWALPGVGQPLTMYEFSGQEIDRLDVRNSKKNKINASKEIYQLFHSHITNHDKPDFEKFIRSTPYTDVGHLYYNAFRSSFRDSCYFIYECPHCKNVFVEKKDIDDTVSYSDDNAKEEFIKIFEYSGPYIANKIKVVKKQVSDKFLFSIKQPSIYDTVIEQAAIPDKIRRERENICNLIQFIEDIYVIDMQNRTLTPLKYDTKNSITDDTVNKILQYEKVINILTSDQYNRLLVEINKIQKDEFSEKIKFIIPKATCPKCNKEIKEEETSGAELLFSRHQLELIRVL